MTTLKYGNYSHVPTPRVAMRAERVGAATGARQATKRTWEIDGLLVGTSQADIDTKVDALIAAYAADGSDLTLYANDGTTVLQQLDSSAAIHGTRIVGGVEFPEGKGAEYCTIRHYRVVVEATFLETGKLFTTGYGSIQRKDATAPDGTLAITVTGDVTADTIENARTAAASAELDGNLTVTTETQESADEKKVTFRYDYIDQTNSREVMEYSEEIGVQEAVVRTVYREVLDGGTPIKQTTTGQPARGWQRGQAVGRTGYPSFPSVAWNSSYLSEPIAQAKASPKRLADGLTGYPISWDYKFMFATTPAFATPGVPPE